MEQGAEVAPLRFGNRSFEPRRFPLGQVFVANRADNEQRLHGAVVEWNRMSAQAVLREVGEHEGGHAVELLDLFGRLAEILFLVEFEVKRVVSFEHMVQNSFESLRGDRRIGKDGQDLSQFGDRGDAIFIPVKVRLLQTSKRLIGLLVLRRLQHAGIE